MSILPLLFIIINSQGKVQCRLTSLIKIILRIREIEYSSQLNIEKILHNSHISLCSYHNNNNCICIHSIAEVYLMLAYLLLSH